MKTVRLSYYAAAAALAFTAAGCSDDKSTGAAEQTLRADIASATDPSVSLGTATFTTQGEGEVTAKFAITANNVISSGKHAIHIHENGSCDSVDTDGDGQADAAGAAGGHFNPTNAGHGEDNGPHAGDSDDYNYSFNDDGSFRGEVSFTTVPQPAAQKLFADGGTAVVIHAGADDKQTDPSGEAGPRVACGVIKVQ